MRRASRRHAVPVLLAMLVATVVVVAETIEIDFPDLGASIYMISLPTTINTPPIGKAEDLLDAVPNGVFVGKFLAESDHVLVYGDGPCRDCQIATPDPEEGPLSVCVNVPSQGAGCGSDCFCIDPSEGLGYFVKTSGSGTLVLDGTDGATPITLLEPGPLSNSGRTIISLPQDATAETACELVDDIGGAVLHVEQWVRSVGAFSPYPGPTNFPIADGEAYIARVSADTTYTPSTGAGSLGASCPGPCPVCPPLEYDLTLESLNLTGGPFPMPLASDPTNALPGAPASQEGYGFVESLVTISLSSQRPVDPGPATLGSATATLPCSANPPEGACDVETGAIDPPLLEGFQFGIHSFFDVFFDVTVTDVDDRPGRDYVGLPDGASFTMEDNGPTRITAQPYARNFDEVAPNYGLIPPPEVAPYMGHFLIEIPLGYDINGNAENDKIKFTLGSHGAQDQNRTFIELPDGSWIDEFDSAAFLAGAIVDESTDPPFQIGANLPNGLPDPAVFGGPTVATSLLRNPLIQAPAIPITTEWGLILLAALLIAIVAVGVAVWRK